jgi:heme-degrading monooxygenase HmoA
MIKMLTRFEVEDFSKWKAGFLAAENIRTAAGAKSAQAFQSTDNPRMVVVITEWDSIEKAKTFSQSPTLREAQQKSGVLLKPEVYELKSM